MRQDTQSAPANTTAAERRGGLACALSTIRRALGGAAGAPAGLDAPRLRAAVETLYTQVATDPGGGFHFNRGAAYASTLLGYDGAELAALPETATAPFAGVGNPLLISPLRPDEVVLDFGAGAGMDLLLAARRVGPHGRAIGVDSTAAMVGRSRASIAAAGLTNVDILRGEAEHLPFGDSTMDVVMSNGVLNLVPDKRRALREVFRVLRPGGRLLLADLVIGRRLAWLVRRNASLWALCVGGALQEADLMRLLTGLGFDEVRVTQRFDCARGSSLSAAARWLGVRGANIHAAKPS
jgi:arsenite methyltransferase